MAAASMRLLWRRLLVPRSFSYGSGFYELSSMPAALRCIHTTHTLLNGNEINITESCVKQMKKILDRDEFLRIIIEGGGCSGFQYKFEVDTSLQDDDRTFSTEGGKVVVDVDSLQLIVGSTIDFQEELIKSSFVVKTNPNADKGCSCGASFSVKI